MSESKSVSKELAALVKVVSKGASSALESEDVLIESNRHGIAVELRAYGEDSVASEVEAASAKRIEAIGKRSAEIIFAGEKPPKALCLAALEILEGRQRPLARKRRRGMGRP